ncbi:hypothetical protein C8Q75DRAFT_811321 [Abortiporus biennis]|nr:hypothetical protein C8Q75DRAFT_811321 [Abortiporus biennis]
MIFSINSPCNPLTFLPTTPVEVGSPKCASDEMEWESAIKPVHSLHPIHLWLNNIQRSDIYLTPPPSPPASMDFEHSSQMPIPKELITKIISHIASTDDKNTLNQCSLVSRTWKDISRPLLFSSLYIRLPGSSSATSSMERSTSISPSKLTRGDAFLIQYTKFFTSHPELSSLVKELIISGYDAFGDGRKVATNVLWRLQCGMTNLRSLRILSVSLSADCQCPHAGPDKGLSNFRRHRMRLPPHVPFSRSSVRSLEITSNFEGYYECSIQSMLQVASWYSNLESLTVQNPFPFLSYQDEPTPFSTQYSHVDGHEFSSNPHFTILTPQHTGTSLYSSASHSCRSGFTLKKLKFTTPSSDFPWGSTLSTFLEIAKRSVGFDFRSLEELDISLCDLEDFQCLGKLLRSEGRGCGTTLKKLSLSFAELDGDGLFNSSYPLSSLNSVLNLHTLKTLSSLRLIIPSHIDLLLPLSSPPEHSEAQQADANLQERFRKRYYQLLWLNILVPILKGIIRPSSSGTMDLCQKDNRVNSVTTSKLTQLSIVFTHESEISSRLLKEHLEVVPWRLLRELFDPTPGLDVNIMGGLRWDVDEVGEWVHEDTVGSAFGEQEGYVEEDDSWEDVLDGFVESELNGPRTYSDTDII